MPALPDGQEFTDKEQAFIDEYGVDHNATQAAIRAGYSPRTAARKGPALRNSPRIGAEIDRRLAERSARCGITADRLMELSGAILFAKLKSYGRWGGGDRMALFSSEDISEWDQLALSEVTEEEKFIKGGLGRDGDEVLMSRTSKVKVQAKDRLLTELMRAHGLLGSKDGDGGPGGSGKDGDGSGDVIKTYTQEDWERVPS
jgi:hypothetical protein